MKRRTVFDVLFGIIGPLVCVCLDPMVFRYNLADPPLGFSSAYLGAYQAFSYAAILLSCIFLTIHVSGVRLQASLRFMLSGGLLSSALFAFAIGIALLPYTLMGMFIIIGFLGFAPFFAGRVYMRCAFDSGAEKTRRRWPLTICGALAFFATAAGFQLLADRSFTQAIGAMTSSHPEARNAALSSLRRWSHIFGHQQLVAGYHEARSDDRRRAFADAYQSLTGRDIEADLRSAND